MIRKSGLHYEDDFDPSQTILTAGLSDSGTG